MFDDKEKDQIKAAFGQDTEQWEEGPLKQVLVDYVGSSSNTEEVTSEMIVETMANEFPEFLMAIAEENWIRGYQQAIHDIDEGRRLLEENTENNDDGTTR